MTGSWPLRLTAVGVMVAAALFGGAPTVEQAPIPAPPTSTPAPPPPERPPLAPDVLAATVVPTIVAITADSATTSTAGTGIVLTDDGLVVTNHHVVVGARTVSARSFETGARYDVDVLGYDSSRDVAVLQLGGAQSLTPAVLGAVTDVRIGGPVTAFGNAEGDGAAVAAPGTVTGLEQTLTARRGTDGSLNRLTGMIEVDAAVRPGDSGGPLVDDTGVVVGVNTAGNAEADPDEPVGAPRSYAIPMDVVTQIVEQVRSGTSSDTVRVGPTPVLGVTVTNDERGAKVLWVGLWSPAEAAGMKVGDVVTALDGRPIASSRELTTSMMQRGPGDTIGLSWVDRDGVAHDEQIVLEQGPPR